MPKFRKYSVSLVYTKPSTDKTEIILKVMHTEAINQKEALGHTLLEFENHEEIKDYSLSLYTVALIQI